MGTQPPLQKGGRTPQFSAHIYYSQTAAWIKMPLGMEVGLSPDDIVLHGKLLKSWSWLWCWNKSLGLVKSLIYISGENWLKKYRENFTIRSSLAFSDRKWDRKCQLFWLQYLRSHISVRKWETKSQRKTMPQMTSVVSGSTAELSSALLLHTLIRYLAVTSMVFYCRKTTSKNSQEVGCNCRILWKTQH